jgi:Ku70/Ku80 beta-barrel domain
MVCSRALQCRARVGVVFCAFLSCLARFISRRRPRARNPFACTRCGGRAAAKEPDADEPAPDRGGQVASGPRPQLVDPGAIKGADLVGTATRIGLRPHDPRTGEEIAKSEVVKGYEYDRGQFITFTAEELKALDIESSKVVDLETFVPRGDIDAVYFDSPYYLYPDGPIAVEALRVIGVAMAEAGAAGIGRLTLSRRERMVMVEPRGTGWRYSRCAPPPRSGQHNSPARRATSMPRWSRSPARSSDSHGEIRPEHVPRPLSRGVTGADRSQAERVADQTPRGDRAATGDRSDGGAETQSRTGNACHRRCDSQRKASQTGSRSAPALIASARSRRPKKEGRDRDRAGRRRCEVAEEGVNVAISTLTRQIRLALLSARRLLGRTEHYELALGPGRLVA